MKEDGRKLSKQQQVEARRRAMLLVNKGWNERSIAEAVGVHPRTVQQWKQHQREHGTQALLCDERGRKHGEKRLMSDAQEKEVRKLICDKLPEQLKLPFALWTRKAVAQLLAERSRSASASSNALSVCSTVRVTTSSRCSRMTPSLMLMTLRGIAGAEHASFS